MTGRPARLRPLLLPVLVLLFILVSVLEVWLLTAVAARITVWATLLILIAEAVVGAWLMRREGSKAWQALVNAYGTGKMPSGQIADAALILVGGVMLILPGFFTDIIGLICLLPLTRPLARRGIGFLIAAQAARSGVDFAVMRAKVETETVIRGETVEDASAPGPEASDPVVKGEIED